MGSTGVVLMSDTACQTARPAISFADMKGNDKKARFYTGFVSFPAMLLIFTTLLKHGAKKLNYWDWQKRSLGAKVYHKEGVGQPGRT